MPEKDLRDELFKWYHAYAYSFASEGKLLPAMKKLKYDHSLRVAVNARLIARKSGWGAREEVLAELCGLFHDIGRYRQYREHKTFQDHRSVNHAELGALVMEETGCLAPLPQEWRTVVIESTRLHNLKEIPGGLAPEVERYTRLVRDADKLDIYHVIYDAVAHDHLGDYPEITHGVDLEREPSPEIVEAVRRHERIAYSTVRSLNDFLLILLQWTYEMNYRGSFELMRERALVDKVASILPAGAQLADIVESAHAHVAEMARAE